MTRAPRRGGDQVIPRPVDWALGSPMPWSDNWAMPPAGHVGAMVAAHPIRHRPPAFDDARPSAVLVVLADVGPNGATSVLLTRRSTTLSSHRGEISFPGGRLDDGESFEAAALREADEEVGLASDFVDVVGRLDPLSTLVSRSFIVPIVAVVPAGAADTVVQLVAPRTSEVDRVMWVPLADLARSDTYREELWLLPPDRRSVYFFELDDETVWGATARVLHQLLTVVHGATMR